MGRSSGAVRGREQARREVDAERGEALLGSFAGGVEAADSAATAAGAAEHVGAESPGVKGGPVEAVPGWLAGREGREGELRRRGRRRRRLEDEGPERGVRGVGAVEGSEVEFGRRQEGHQSADEGGSGEDEGGAALGGVLVLAVVKPSQARLGHRSAGAVADLCGVAHYAESTNAGEVEGP